MLVRVLKTRVPRVGKRGDTKDLPPKAAKLLILIGAVESAEGPKPPKAKREYMRRDMQAESKSASRKRRPA